MAGARRHRCLDRERGINPIVDARIDGREVLDGQLIERHAPAFRQLYRAAGDMVRLAERDVRLPNEPVGEIGSGRIAEFGGGAHAARPEGRLGHHAGHRRNRKREQRGRFEHWRLVVLHILRIGQRQALHRNH
jgi:hypothetical protein